MRESHISRTVASFASIPTRSSAPRCFGIFYVAGSSFPAGSDPDARLCIVKKHMPNPVTPERGNQSFWGVARPGRAGYLDVLARQLTP